MVGTSDRILTREMMLQGVGLLISWNSILSTLDWYKNRFPHKNPGF